MNSVVIKLAIEAIGEARSAIMFADAFRLQDLIESGEKQLLNEPPAMRQALEDLLATARIVHHAANKIRETSIPKEDLPELVRQAKEEMKQAKNS